MSARAGDIRARIARPKTPHLRVVKRRRSKKLIKRDETRRAITFLIVAGILAGGIVAAILLEQVLLAQSAFHVSDLRGRLEAAEETHEVLVLEAAQLDSSARIERYARDVLGMIEPVPETVQYIVADIKQPKELRVGVGRGHRTTLPTGGVAIGDPYMTDGGAP
jgi:cell division protein FtsB